jgi:hypothetical protein
MRALITTALALALALASRPARGQGASPEAPAPASPPELMTVALDAGLGIGTRSYERPLDVQRQRLQTTPFLAADIALRVRRCVSDCPSAHYALDFLLRYQTSIAMRVEQPLFFALPSEVAARSSRLELSVAPIFRLGDRESSMSIAVPVGAMVRSLQAEHRDLPLPSYSLFGPHLRVEARLPLGRYFTLRAGPEAQWILVMGERLKDEGTQGSGVGLGVEAAVSVNLMRHFGLELSYRQAHALASGKAGRADFEDIERFATLQLSGRL